MREDTSHSCISATATSNIEYVIQPSQEHNDENYDLLADEIIVFMMNIVKYNNVHSLLNICWPSSIQMTV